LTARQGDSTPFADIKISSLELLASSS